MREYENKSDMNTGLCIMAYAETNFGKTHSIGTLPGLTYMINTEPKDPRIVTSYAGDKIKIFECDSFDEYMELLISWEKEAKEGKLKADNVAFDSLSFLQGVFKTQFEDDHADRKSSKQNTIITLYDRFSMGDDTMMGWGGLSSILKRITMRLNSISKYGKITLATCTEMQNPKYRAGGGYVQYGPFFQGREYPNLMNAYFHLIGRIIEPWKLVDGKFKLPIISFVSDDGDYVARATGNLARIKQGPLDWTKIINIVKSKKENIKEGGNDNG